MSKYLANGYSDLDDLIAYQLRVADWPTNDQAIKDYAKHTANMLISQASQASKIDSLRSEVLLKADYGRTTNAAYESCITERDHLKAKNEKLVEALKHLTHNTKKSGANVGLALDVAIQALKENA